MSVYEVHLGSWRTGLSYRDLAHQLTEHVVSLGFTHVELLPVAEHPFGGSWGYQVTSYYAPTSRFGHPDDFRYLVDRLHHAGVGVIVDWVPAHFPKDEWALARFDGTPLYEHPDPLLGEHPDWGTYVFDFGRSEVRNFLVANATYWLEEFHVDGLRVDAVASMLYLDYSRKPGQWRPNKYGGRENLDAIAFLQEANATAYRRTPGIMMIAEESTAWPGVTAPTDASGLGFGLKWNMGWMNDTLRYMAEEPVHRRYHHGEITFSMVYAYSEHFVLPLSHDEVVHGKGSLYERMPGDHWQKLAGVRLLLAYQWTHPGKQLLFMGSEFGQQTEWTESAVPRLARPRGPRPPGHARRVGPQPRLPGQPRAVAARPRPRRLRVDRLRRRLPQRARLHPPGIDCHARRRGGELRRRPARGLPARPAPRRSLARGHQHRRGRLRRLGRRQPRPGRGTPRAALRPPVLRLDPCPPARRGDVRGRLTRAPRHAQEPRTVIGAGLLLSLLGAIVVGSGNNGPTDTPRRRQRFRHIFPTCRCSVGVGTPRPAAALRRSGNRRSHPLRGGFF